MRLVKKHYFVDGTWSIQQAQEFLASCNWILALIHCNNFGLTQSSYKKAKYIAVHDVSQ